MIKYYIYFKPRVVVIKGKMVRVLSLIVKVVKESMPIINAKISVNGYCKYTNFKGEAEFLDIYPKSSMNIVVDIGSAYWLRITEDWEFVYIYKEAKITEDWEITIPKFKLRITEDWEITIPKFKLRITEDWEE